MIEKRHPVERHCKCPLAHMDHLPFQSDGDAKLNRAEDASPNIVCVYCGAATRLLWSGKALCLDCFEAQTERKKPHSEPSRTHQGKQVG